MATPPGNALPHDKTYTRLMLSPIHGVGVFAIRDIPKGTNIFADDHSKMVWIDKQRLKDLDPEMKRLYEDFAVRKGQKYGCPDSFNNLTPAWYLNESKEHPNVQCTSDYEFLTLQDIKKGEELTVDYSTYSDEPDLT